MLRTRRWESVLSAVSMLLVSVTFLLLVHKTCFFPASVAVWCLGNISKGGGCIS